MLCLKILCQGAVELAVSSGCKFFQIPHGHHCRVLWSLWLCKFSSSLRLGVIGANSHLGGGSKADIASRFVAYWLCYVCVANSSQLFPWQTLMHLQAFPQENLFLPSPHRDHCHQNLHSPLPGCCDRIATHAILSFPAAKLLSWGTASVIAGTRAVCLHTF